jgi:hypothetical protein
MGQVLHRGATTAEAIRRAIQHSQESLTARARRHGINRKTVAKWWKRCSTAVSNKAIYCSFASNVQLLNREDNNR